MDITRPTEPKARLGIGPTLRQAGDLLAAYWWLILIASLCFATGASLIEGAMRMAHLPDPFPGDYAFELFWTLFGNLLGHFALVTLASLVISRTLGEGLSPQGALWFAVRLIPQLTALYLLTTLAIVLGTIALIVPAIILTLALCVAPVVLAAETDNPIRAFVASMELTRNNRLRILVLTSLPSLLIAGISFAADAMLVNFTTTQPGSGTVDHFYRYEWLTNYVVWPVTVLLYDLMSAPLMVAIYLQLKQVKAEPIGSVEPVGDTFA
jgi:hypothetical protein